MAQHGKHYSDSSKGFDHEMLSRPIFVAADDGGGVSGTMAGAVLGVAEPLAASGVEQVGGG